MSSSAAVVFVRAFLLSWLDKKASSFRIFVPIHKFGPRPNQARFRPPVFTRFGKYFGRDRGDVVGLNGGVHDVVVTIVDVGVVARMAVFVRVHLNFKLVTTNLALLEH